MRTAEVCPECLYYINAKCVIYNGDYLSAIDVAPSENLEEILVKINDAIGAGCCGDIVTTTTTTTAESTTTTTTTIGEESGYITSSATLLYNACSNSGDFELHYLYWMGEFSTGTILYEDPFLTIPWDNPTGIFIHPENGEVYNINIYSNVVGIFAGVCPTTTTTTTTSAITTTTSTTVPSTTTTTTTDPNITTTTTTTDPNITTTTTTTVAITTTTTTTIIQATTTTTTTIINPLSVTFLVPGTENHHAAPPYIDWASNGFGSGIIEKGICWGSSPNPTIAGDHQAYGIAEEGYYSLRCYAAHGTRYWKGYVTDGITIVYYPLEDGFVSYVYNY
jgi:hypothetical protein